MKTNIIISGLILALSTLALANNAPFYCPQKKDFKLDSLNHVVTAGSWTLGIENPADIEYFSATFAKTNNSVITGCVYEVNYYGTPLLMEAHSSIPYAADLKDHDTWKYFVDSYKCSNEQHNPQGCSFYLKANLPSTNVKRNF